jgi:hypothetical protein
MAHFFYKENIVIIKVYFLSEIIQTRADFSGIFEWSRGNNHPFCPKILAKMKIYVKGKRTKGFLRKMKTNSLQTICKNVKRKSSLQRKMT